VRGSAVERFQSCGSLQGDAWCSPNKVPAERAAKALRGMRSVNPLGVSRQATWERFATTEHEQRRKIMLERFGG
jgi:hypothetical protein